MTGVTICVFCGSRNGAHPAYLEAAADLGTALGNSGSKVVYGGASIGLMGAVADAALAKGAEVVGIIPSAFEAKEIAHRGLTRLEVVDSLLTRKARMAELSDAFIGLPGGGGTLDEVFEMFTWSQLGLHRKPIVMMQVRGYYDALESWLDHAIAEGFIDAHQRELISFANETNEALESIRTALRALPSSHG